jgi:hypothetical protein
MTKPISTRMHGLIDYSWTAAATEWSRRADGATAIARLLRYAAATATATSFVTNYEAGRFRLLPMRAHLAMDFALSAALIASPLYLPRHERRYAKFPVLLGAMGLVAGLLTAPRSPLEIDEEFGGLYGGRLPSETDRIDRNVMRSPRAGLHLE